MGSEKSKWIGESLTYFPQQPLVSFEELTQLLMDLTDTQSGKRLDEKREEIVSKPVSQWASLLKSCLENSAQVPYDMLELDHVIAEL